MAGGATTASCLRMPWASPFEDLAKGARGIVKSVKMPHKHALVQANPGTLMCAKLGCKCIRRCCYRHVRKNR